MVGVSCRLPTDLTHLLHLTKLYQLKGTIVVERLWELDGLSPFESRTRAYC